MPTQLLTEVRDFIIAQVQHLERLASFDLWRWRLETTMRQVQRTAAPVFAQFFGKFVAHRWLGLWSVQEEWWYWYWQWQPAVVALSAMPGGSLMSLDRRKFGIEKVTDSFTDESALGTFETASLPYASPTSSLGPP